MVQSKKLASRLTAKEKFWGIMVLVAILVILIALLTLKDFLIQATPSFVASAEPFDVSGPLGEVLLAYYQTLFLPAGGLLAGIMLIYAGIVYASSAGEPGRITLAKEIMAGAILGFILLISVGFVVKTITPSEEVMKEIEKIQQQTPQGTTGGGTSGGIH